MATVSSSRFGQTLRRLRLVAGLSQEELAERAGLSARGVSDLERGLRACPRPETVRLLADALALGPEERASLVAAAHPELTDASPTPAASSVPTPPTTVIAIRRPSLDDALLTQLVGREAELAQVGALLRSDVRLVTLTGPGGVGKTQLALAVAAQLDTDERFADGVTLVELAPVSDPALVLSVIAAEIGISDSGGGPLISALREALRPRRLLLVIDNFEHVLPAALLVAELLAGCPRLVVLATSRDRLHLRGEREVHVEPLALPPPTDPGLVEDLAGVAAVQLFVERAVEARPGFALTTENAMVVAEICRRLDGLPLAIELAAAWVRVLPPSALLERLDQRLPLLGGGARDLPARQQTLRSTIAWSYDLLSAAEQALFRRLAVFTGGCTLEAAEDVISTVEAPAIDVLRGIASLVEKNLLQPVDDRGGGARYMMLETVRAFGLEQLAASGEEAAIRQQHAAWCLNLAERADPDLLNMSPGNQSLWRLVAERDNLRTALDWSHQSGDAETLLRLAGALSMYWYFRSALGEGRHWLETALASENSAPAPTRARALLGAGLMVLYQGDHDRAGEYLNAALAGYRSMGDRFHEPYSLFLLGVVAEDSGHYDRAAALLEESRTLFNATGNVAMVACACYHLGVVASGQGDFGRATARLDEALDLARSVGVTFVIRWIVARLGLVATERGDLARAADLLHEGMVLGRNTGDTHATITDLGLLGVLAVASDRPLQAARFFGVTQALCKVTGVSTFLKEPERTSFERAIASTRTQLDKATFDAAWGAGTRLTIEEAVDEALTLTEAIAAESTVTVG